MLHTEGSSVNGESAGQKQKTASYAARRAHVESPAAGRMWASAPTVQSHTPGVPGTAGVPGAAALRAAGAIVPALRRGMIAPYGGNEPI